MRGAEVATPRSLASSLTWWSFCLCRGGRPSPYIWGTRLHMLKPGACWVNWDELLALLYTSLGPVDASSVLRPWGFHGVVCWCHAARPLGASVYPRLSWAARQWPPSGGTRVCVPLPEGVFSRTPRSARRCPQPARESTVGDSAGRVGAGVCRA